MSTLTAMAATNNPTKTAPAAKGTETMTKFKYSAALLLCLAGLGSGGVSAQSMILKNAAGGTLVQYPLTTSASCVLTGTGDIELKPQPAAGTSGDGWCPQGAAPTAPTFPAALSVTPTAIITGNTVSASWTSAGAQTCSGTATRNGSAVTVSGWTGSQPTTSPAPSLQFTISSAGAYVFTITCTNTAGSTPSSSTTINVSDPGTGACAGVPPSPFANLTRQTTFNNTTALRNEANQNMPLGATSISFWSPFIGTQFPQIRGENGVLPVEVGKFVAFEFNTGTVTLAAYGGAPGAPTTPNRFGTVEWVPPGSNEGQPVVAISECPGVFDNLPAAPGDPNNNAECRGLQSGSGGITWGIDPTGNNFVCRLQENKTYYVNVAYVNFSTGLSTCAVPDATNACHWLETVR